MKDPLTNEAVIRSYTPISETSAKGYLEVLVKVYLDTPERQGGKMTKAMDVLSIGETIEFKGPIGKFRYLGKGRCSVNGATRLIKKFYMICGGSGITPIFQVFRAVMQDSEDHTNCIILDGNRLLEDILCKEELDHYAKLNPHKSTVHYTLTKAPEDWPGLKGRIGPQLLSEHVVRVEDAMVLICGPETLEKAVHAALNRQGWPNSDLLFF
jgi:nitrate reductase (NAD(P)H)